MLILWFVFCAWIGIGCYLTGSQLLREETQRKKEHSKISDLGVRQYFWFATKRSFLGPFARSRFLKDL